MLFLFFLYSYLFVYECMHVCTYHMCPWCPWRTEGTGVPWTWSSAFLPCFGDKVSYWPGIHTVGWAGWPTSPRDREHSWVVVCARQALYSLRHCPSHCCFLRKSFLNCLSAFAGTTAPPTVPYLGSIRPGIIPFLKEGA